MAALSRTLSELKSNAVLEVAKARASLPPFGFGNLLFDETAADVRVYVGEEFFPAHKPIICGI